MSSTEPQRKRAIVALGGNAITTEDREDTIPNQFYNTRRSMASIVQLAGEGYDICVSHGNGPQVGNAIFRVEMTQDRAPELPLGICVADTQGGMGYMIEQSLQNRLNLEKIDRKVCTVITQMVVDINDASIQNPTKYIGQFYSEEIAKDLASQRGWTVKKDGDRGWRRVVASPLPLTCVEKETIKILLDNHFIVVAAGGGGIPVYIDPELGYEGVDAVIDKDRASAVLGREIGAELFIILTPVDQVAINFGTDKEQGLGEITVTELKRYYSEGHFPPGSMGPKVEAAIDFINNGGRKVIITSINLATEALAGKAGTVVHPD